MNRADRRAMGCRGGRHVWKNAPSGPDGSGPVVKGCAACGFVPPDQVGADG